MDRTVETYDKIAQHYADTHPNSIYTEDFEEFSKLVRGRILEIGCGFGRDGDLLMKAGFDYTGIDASKTMLEIARNRYPNGNFLLMDLYKLNFPQASFDGFVAMSSLLHVPKNRLGSVLRSIHTLLKPGGVGLISMKEKRDMDEGIIKENKAGGIERYFSFYTTPEFTETSEREGFSTIRNYRKTDPQGDIWLCFFVKKV